MKPRFQLGYHAPVHTGREVQPPSRSMPRTAHRLRVPDWRRLARPLAWINVALGAVVLGEMAAGVGMMVKPLPPIDVSAAPRSAQVVAQPSSEPAAQTTTTSLASLASRPLFRTGDDHPSASSTPQTTASAISTQARSWTARLNVQGIMMAAAVPQAVLEDTQTKKTYIITVGQQILDGLLVKEIRQGRVILDLQGERIELNL